MRFVLFNLFVLVSCLQINFSQTAPLEAVTLAPVAQETVTFASSENLAANRRPTTTTPPKSDQPWQDSFEFPPLPDCKKGNCNKNKHNQVPRLNQYEMSVQNNVYDQSRQLSDYDDSYPETYSESVPEPVEGDSYSDSYTEASDAYPVSNGDSDKQLGLPYGEAYSGAYGESSNLSPRQFGESLAYGESYAYGESSGEGTSRQFGFFPYGEGLYGGGLYGEATGESGFGEGLGFGYGEGSNVNTPAFRNNPCRNGINSLRCNLSRRRGLGFGYGYGFGYGGFGLGRPWGLNPFYY